MTTRSWLCLALLLFVAGRCLVPMDETDLFFNLRLGAIVLDTGRVPTTNLLSFTYPDAPDVNLAWLFQILLVAAHALGGIAGTVVLKTGFAIATFALLFAVANRRGAHPALAALALGLSAWAAEPRFVERPHLVTFVGLAYLLLAIERAEAGHPRALWSLMPLGLVWANANSCFFLAPAVLILYAIGARLDGSASRDQRQLRASATRALLVAAALVPLMFATPSGLGWFRYIGNHFRMPYLRPLEEYRDARWPLDGPFFFLVGGLVVAFVLSLVTRGRSRGHGAGDGDAALPWRTLLPVAALGLLGARRIRFVAEFALLAGPVLAVAFTRIFTQIFTQIWALRSGRLLAPGVATLLVLLTIVPRGLAARAGARWIDLGIEPDLIPAAAIAFVDQQGLRGRMYNDLEVGSYLTWQGWPRYRVFQDPRINGYPDEMHAILRRPDLTRIEWQVMLERFAVDAALISFPGVNPRGALFDPERWALVHRGRDALVFSVRSPARARLLAAHELPWTFAYSQENGLAAQPLAIQPASSIVPACEWQRRLGDAFAEQRDHPRALAAYRAALLLDDCLTPAARQATRRAVGALALRLGDPVSALDALAGIDDPDARANRGFALVHAARSAEALAEFDAVLAVDPRHDNAAFGRGLALEALGRYAEASRQFESLLVRAPDHLAAPTARSRLRALQGRDRNE